MKQTGITCALLITQDSSCWPPFGGQFPVYAHCRTRIRRRHDRFSSRIVGRYRSCRHPGHDEIPFRFEQKFGVALLLGVMNSGLPFLMYCLAATRLPAGYSAILNATTP
jgi:drug/metabolite transporter (DMT)-like permease